MKNFGYARANGVALANSFLQAESKKSAGTVAESRYFRFSTHFHPFACDFVNRLARSGIDGFLKGDSQLQGNAYLGTPWKIGYAIDVTPGIGCAATLAHRASPNEFHGLVTLGSELWHYWHDNSSITNGWEAFGGKITDQVAGPAGLAVDRTKPLLHAVVPRTDGLWHYMIDLDSPTTSPTSGARISAVPGAKGSVIHALANSEQAVAGNLEAIVLEGQSLVYYRLDSSGTWQRVEALPAAFTGPASLAQSSYRWGKKGNFEIIAPQGSKLVHWARDNNNGAWWQVAVITDDLWVPAFSQQEGALGPASLIQGRISDGWHGNYEAVVREGSNGQDLVHYWKDNSTPDGRWHRGRVITSAATGAGSIVHGPWGTIGNFEVLVPENGRVAHYWHSNEGSRFYFRTQYDPTGRVLEPFPRHDVDFASTAAYGIYNREIFFHIPHLLATTLSTNNRFDEATRWFHYVFDPTTDADGSGAARYWKYPPFRDSERKRIDDFLTGLTGGNPEAKAQIQDWQQHPFDPFRIGNLRQIAYQKHVVMKYVDNRLAQGDQAFRNARSLEDLNLATQHYIVAANILGKAPQKVPPRGRTAPATFDDLVNGPQSLDLFSNAIVELENELPYSSYNSTAAPSTDAGRLLGMAHTLFFWRCYT